MDSCAAKQSLMQDNVCFASFYGEKLALQEECSAILASTYMKLRINKHIGTVVVCSAEQHSNQSKYHTDTGGCNCGFGVLLPRERIRLPLKLVIKGFGTSHRLMPERPKLLKLCADTVLYYTLVWSNYTVNSY